MAFIVGKPKSDTAVDAAPVSNINESDEDPGSGHPILYDGKSLEQDGRKMTRMRATNPGGIVSAEKSARSAILRLLNGMKVISPALRLVVETEHSPEAQADRFIDIMDRAKKFSNLVAGNLGVDCNDGYNDWILNVLKGVYIESSGGGKLEVENISGKMLDALVNVSMDNEFEHGEDISPGDDVAVKMALAKGLSKVISAQQEFDFYRADLDADIHDCATALVNTSMALVGTLANPMATSSDRKLLFSTLLQQGGHILASSWNVEARISASMFKRKNIAVATWRKSNPNGFPLTAVFQRFDRHMATMSKMLSSVKRAV